MELKRPARAISPRTPFQIPACASRLSSQAATRICFITLMIGLAYFLPPTVWGQTLVNLSRPQKADEKTLDLQGLLQVTDKSLDRFQIMGAVPASRDTSRAELDRWKTLLSTARKQFPAFAELLEFVASHPSTKIPNTTLGNAVRVAVIAAAPDKYYTFLEKTDPEYHRNFDEERSKFVSLLEDVRARNNAPWVVVFADGNIRGAARGEESNTPVGTGALGVQIDKPQGIWTGQVTVASTLDTIEGSLVSAAC